MTDLPDHWRLDAFHHEDGNTSFYISKFKAIRETPCGYWVREPGWAKKERWVSKTSCKRYAYPTKAEAKTAFIARRKRQLQIIAYQHTRTKAALRDIKDVDPETLRTYDY